MFDISEHAETLSLCNRKGFVKIALQTGESAIVVFLLYYTVL
jgi:hypothetical protein